MTNFRRLLLEGADLHKEPPQNPPKDWRLKCQGLLPEGKVMVLKMFIFLRIFYSEADPDLIYIRWGPKRFPGPKKGGGGFPRSTNVIVLLHIIGRGCGLSRAPLAGRGSSASCMLCTTQTWFSSSNSQCLYMYMYLWKIPHFPCLLTVHLLTFTMLTKELPSPPYHVIRISYT